MRQLGSLLGILLTVSFALAAGGQATAAMTASGSGTFVHTSSSGLVKGFGTWTATGLQSFTLAGCDGGPFPPNFCGGLAVLNIHTSGTSSSPSVGHVEHEGTIAINCL